MTNLEKPKPNFNLGNPANLYFYFTWHEINIFIGSWLVPKYFKSGDHFENVVAKYVHSFK